LISSTATTSARSIGATSVDVLRIAAPFRLAIPCPLYGSADFCDAMTPEIAEAEDRIRKKLSDV